MTINCIAIDDEPLALGLVCSFIKQTPFLNLTAQYSSAVEALKGIQELPVQLIFLDIQMPDLNGLELAKIINQRSPLNQPRIIFTTAFNHFAIEGYKVDALDYLLKPFSYEEFLRAAHKASGYFELLHKQEQPQSTSNDKNEEYIFIKVEYQLVKVSLDQILYIEALKDYVKIYLQGQPKPLLSLMSLKNLEERLPSGKFMRVQRSFIIALNKIDSVTKNMVQIGPAHITVGEQYKEGFKQFINQWL